MKKLHIRKTIAYLLSMMLLVAIAACATPAAETPPAPTPAPEQQEETPDTPEPTPETATDVDRPLVIGFANFSLANPYCAVMAEGAAERAAELGIELNVVDNRTDADHQRATIEDFVTMGVDGILILPVDNVAIEHVVQEAIDVGISVIANSMQVDAAQMFVAADDHEMGYNLGKATAAWLNEYNDGVGKVAYINNPALRQIVEREQGFMDAMEAYAPGAEIVMRVTAGTAEEALAASETIIQAHPDIVAISAYNDETALGAALAMEAAGFDPDTVFVGGVDATPEALAQIRAGGVFKATVDNVPFQNGRLLIDLIVRLIDGETIDFRYIVPTEIVDKNNIEDFF